MPEARNEKRDTVRWLVDGMNLIGSRPDRWWRDRRGAMKRMVEQLEDYSRTRGETITVVFDGRPFDLERGESEVEVVFAEGPGRDAADHEIERMVASGEVAGLRVVTSDKRLASAVRGHGANVVPSGSFRTELEAATS